MQQHWTVSFDLGFFRLRQTYGARSKEQSALSSALATSGILRPSLSGVDASFRAQALSFSRPDWVGAGITAGPRQTNWNSSVPLRRLNRTAMRNLSPPTRPPTPSLDRGPIQVRVRRAFIGTGEPVLSTSQIVEWSHPRPGTNWHHARRSVRRVCERYCIRVGRGAGSARPILWRLRDGESGRR
jgi:hypothetical protein